MPNKNNQQYIVGLVLNRYVLMLLALIAILTLVWYFSEIVAWILVAWVLSMIGRPIMNFLQSLKIGKLKFGPSLSAGLTIFCFFLGLGLFISIFVPMFVTQARNLAAVDYEAIEESLEEPISRANDYLHTYGVSLNDIFGFEEPETQEAPLIIPPPIFKDTIIYDIDTLTGDTVSFLRDTILVPTNIDTTTLIDNTKPEKALPFKKLQEYFNMGMISSWLGSIVGAAGNALITIFSIIFIAFFFLREAQLFTQILQKLTPNWADEKIGHVVADSSKMLTRYFSGVILQILIVTLGLFIGMSILGIPNALLIAFLAALFNVVPYVGPFIGATIGLLLTITASLDLEFYSQMLPLLGKVALVFMIMQMVDNFILQPFIFSNRVYAHPLEIFIIVLIGAQVGGVLGMVLAIPAYTVIRVIAKNFLSEFDIIKNMTQGLEEAEESKPNKT